MADEERVEMERIRELDRIQMEQIRELDMEDLQIEVVDESYCSSSDDSTAHRNEDEGGGAYDGFTFDPCSHSSHAYHGEVDDARHRLNFFDGGTILNLPMIYFEGVVLFPEVILSVKNIEPRFKAAVERALDQVDAPNTIAVVRGYVNPDDGKLQLANVGTTAEIRLYQQLEHDSLNVLVHGQQRFHLQRHWIDVEGAPCAEVQIMSEDLPMKTPRDAFGQLASVINFCYDNISNQEPSDASHSKHVLCYKDIDSDSVSDASFENELSPTEVQMHLSAIKSCNEYNRNDGLSSGANYQILCGSKHHLGRTSPVDLGGSSQHSFDGGSRIDGAGLDNRHQSVHGRQSHNRGGWKIELAATGSKWLRRASRSFWPHWVYRMYDSYYLCQRAAVMWKQIIRLPNMDAVAKMPDILSFHIASKIPVSESLRQELLEIDGISYRLRREIELLECFDPVRCKTCQSEIAKRSEMLEMSSDGALGAYVSPQGYVNEIMTFDAVQGLVLFGPAVEECSWFPGYAWTTATCAICESHMGWLFSATDKKLKPNEFWAVRSFKVIDKVS